MDFRHLIVTCLFSKLRLPFDNQKVKENYAILKIKYQPRLFAYGVGILGDEEASKDLVQETFIAFWENKERLVTYYSVSSYLFKIFQSKCLSYLRKRTLLSDFSSLSELKLKEIEMSYYSSDNINGGTVFMKEVEDLYVKTINDLPDKCREIFILSKEQDVKAADIAEKLGVSVRTVENQIYKAIKIMRHAMREYAVPAIFLVLSNLLNTLSR